MALAETIILAGLVVSPNEGLLKPSDISIPPNVMTQEQNSYNFDTQQRFTGKSFQQASYTYNSLQTYGSNGLPRDATGDDYD